MGDLTNRQNRFAYTRFADDFVLNSNGSGGGLVPDGLPDDENVDTNGNIVIGDGIHDYYPSLYFGIPGILSGVGAPGAQVWEINNSGSRPRAAGLLFGQGTMTFPFVYPGAFTKPDLNSDANALGLIHSPDPTTLRTR